MANTKKLDDEVTAGSVLVVDDEKNIVTVLKAILEKRDFVVNGFTDPKQALDSLRKENYDAVITDLYMPEIDGMAFLGEVIRLYPGLPVIMITAFGTVDSAVDAIKKGAFDYVTKPFEQSEISLVVQKAVNARRLKRLEISSNLDEEISPILFGSSGAMQEIQRLVQKISASPSTVLIQGEAGTGKEMLAEEVHRMSDRAFQGFIKINCAALSSPFFEQDLFGTKEKEGKLSMAEKGTLFIEEISEMNPEVQTSFLAYLEDKKNSDVRLIVASHKDLQKEVKEGNFREDLFYRLNVVPIQLPSLRERKDDLRGLVDFFIRRLNKKLHRNTVGMDDECYEVFRAVAWPGNLRQLEHVLERMMLLSDGSTLHEKDIPKDLRSEIDMSSNHEASRFRDIVKRQTQNLEKDLIEKALQEMDGNITRTAEHLGLSRKGLQLKMKELNIKQ